MRRGRKLGSCHPKVEMSIAYRALWRRSMACRGLHDSGGENKSVLKCGHVVADDPASTSLVHRKILARSAMEWANTPPQW